MMLFYKQTDLKLQTVLTVATFTKRASIDVRAGDTRSLEFREPEKVTVVCFSQNFFC